jgi:hypothetical protein
MFAVHLIKQSIKNLKTTLFAVMAVFLVLSCSSDGDSPSGPAFGTGVGAVSIDGDQYSFDKGLIINNGENQGEDTFNLNIELYSGDFSLNALTGPSGIDNNLSLSLSSTQSSGLKNGTRRTMPMTFLILV